jgi:p-cumate 2,3-dioxygenase alpha subunit
MMSSAMGDGPALVVDDRNRGVFRIHRSTMVSPAVFGLERQHIFYKCWIYLCHDSEIENNGDFVTRDVAGQPLFVVRGRDGRPHCYYNTCPHRGATICREERGNAKRFTCFYHAWTFDSSGRLVSLPDEPGYGEGFDRSERGLQGPPRLAEYRGFWFMSFDPGVEPLVDYLAGAKEYIDLIVDQSEEGMRVLPGSNKYSIGANWKLLVENSMDGYHGMPLHQTYFNYLGDIGGKVANYEGNAGPHMGPRQLGNGHAVIEGPTPYARPIARWAPMFGQDARADIESVRARLYASHGIDRAARMCDTIRLMVVFPNLVINDITAITVRFIDPVAADRMNVTAWALAPKEETAAQVARRIDSYLTFIGPAGFATPDDVEALESCQRGFAAGADPGYSDISRGMKRMPRGNDELQMRAFWRAWIARLQGLAIPEPVELPEWSGELLESLRGS